MSAPMEQEEHSEDPYNDAWLLRPCEVYSEEYSECKSFRGRFHQKYIFGEAQDCSKWKEDFDNCMKFRKYRDVEAMHQVIENEKSRREKRLEDARGNNVWEYRRDPPEDWNRPLPKWSEDHKNSLLAKVQEVKEQEGTLKPSSSCVIS